MVLLVQTEIEVFFRFQGYRCRWQNETGSTNCSVILSASPKSQFLGRTFGKIWEAKPSEYHAQFQRRCDDFYVLPNNYVHKGEAMWGLLSFIEFEAPYDPQPIPHLDTQIAASGFSPFDPCYTTKSNTDIEQLTELEFAIAAYITLVKDLLFADPVHKDSGIEATEIQSVTIKLMNLIEASLCSHSPWRNDDEPLRVRYRKLVSAAQAFKTIVEGKVLGLAKRDAWSCGLLHQTAMSQNLKPIFDAALNAAAVTYLVSS